MPDERVTRLEADVTALKSLTRQLEAGRVALVRELRELSDRVRRLEGQQPPPGPELPPTARRHAADGRSGESDLASRGCERLGRNVAN